MKISTTIRTAFHALRRNVMRAVLTTLGIMIGVAAVIAMVEIGQGSAAAIQRTIASMGANNLLVLPGAATSAGVSYGAGSVMTLTPEDALAIEREAPAVRSVAPVVRARAQVVYGNRNWVPFYIYGTTPSFLNVRDWTTLAQGEMFSERDVRNASKVVVLGQTLVRELFQNESPLGREIRVQNVSFRVIGVLGRKGANMMGMDQDDIVLAPWTTVKSRIAGTNSAGSTAPAAGGSSSSAGKLYPSSGLSLYPQQSSTQGSDTPKPARFANIDQITVAAKSAAAVQPAIAQITALMRDRHHIRPGEPDDFNLRDMTEMTRAVSSTSAMMTNLLLCVALISLVVGGVGIMNIMLVSVTERTREIGLRMAVGAKGSDIMTQFIVEAVVLCLAGGAIGILLGRVASYLIGLLLKWPTASSLSAILVAGAVSGTVGVVFGFYPAWKAAHMDPIEALRYE